MLAAMERVASRFPNDPDVRVIAAEAMMTANAWKLWALDGKPAPGTAKIVAQLEAALAVRPMHPGANHYRDRSTRSMGHHRAPDKPCACWRGGKGIDA